MYIFYPDIFFLQNVMLMISISFFSFQIMQIPIRQNMKEICKGGMAGAAIECIFVWFLGNYQLFVVLSQLCVMPMVLILQTHKCHRISRLRLIIMSYLCVFLFVGIIQWLKNLWKEEEVPVLLVVVAAVFLEVFVAELKRTLQQIRRLYSVILVNGERSYQCIALYDSGNCLREPQGGRMVHIASKQIFDALNIQNSFGLVPYCTLGNQNGELEVYIIDEMKLLLNGKEKRLTNVLVGKEKEGMLKNKRYQVILNEGSIVMDY